MCNLHAVFDGQARCTTCAKAVARANRSGGAYRDDPYWYSDSYYRGYGYYGPGYWGHHYLTGRAHDPRDFTEADASSVQREGDANYETEIGGS